MTAQSGLGFSGLAAINIPDDGAAGEVLTKVTPADYDYDWLAGGGGGAPDDAQYVVLAADATLTNERILTGSGSINVADGGAGNPVTLSVIPGGIDHGGLSGLADDDHLQYLLLAGRAGGQSAIGGLNAGDDLDLTGNSSGADTGIVRINSPITSTYDTISNTTPAEPFAFRWGPTFNTGAAAYIGGFLTVAPVVTIATGVFIPATFSDTSNMLTAATPGFSAFTFINELAVIRNSGNFNLMSGLVMNIGLTHERNTSGTSTTAGTTGTNFSPQTRTTIAGAIMTKTSQIGLRISPTFSTVFLSTVNLGTIVGVDCFAPAVALFQPAAGVENMTAYYGLRIANITFGGGTRIVNAINSALAAATNVRCINHTGTAVSTHNGQLRFEADLVGNTYGLSQDWQDGWGAGGFYFEQQNAPNPVGQFRKSFPSTARMLFDWSVDMELTVNAQLGFSLGAQSGANGNQFGNFVAGAQTVTIGGEYSQFLLTQAGNVTVDANINAFGWTINAPSFTAGTGTLSTAAALNVGGNPNLATVNRVGVRIISNPSGGSGINAALWVTAGLSRFDGRVDINNGIALGGGAAATLGTIGGTGPTAAAQAQWLEVDIGGTAHWIPVWT